MSFFADRAALAIVQPYRKAKSSPASRAAQCGHLGEGERALRRSVSLRTQAAEQPAVFCRQSVCICHRKDFAAVPEKNNQQILIFLNFIKNIDSQKEGLS